MTNIPPETLAAYIATRDKRIAKKQPWSPTPLAEAFHQLLSLGTITMGGRASCGSTCDHSWTIYTSWLEVVRKARKLGYVITETNIPQKNAWAAKAGGFWTEQEFRLDDAEPI